MNILHIVSSLSEKVNILFFPQAPERDVGGAVSYGFRFPTNRTKIVLTDSLSPSFPFLFLVMCLELNIPLRDAEQYRQPDYTLDIRHLLEDGQQKALEKLAHLRNTMQQMEDALRRMEENQRYLQSPALCGPGIIPGGNSPPSVLSWG